MPRVDSIRNQVLQLIRATPFQPFAMVLENGEQIIIEHPENIAFDPTEPGKEHFYVISRRLETFSTFSAVTSISRLDSAKVG
jgi:hypothetical protein